MVDAASPSGGAGFGGRWEEPSSNVRCDSVRSFRNSSDIDFSKRRSGEEAKLHREPQHSRKDEGNCGPRTGRDEALPEGFDKENDDKEGEHEEKAIGDKDAGAGGACAEDMFDMEWRKERTGEEDNQKEDELQDGRNDIFHSEFSR